MGLCTRCSDCSPEMVPSPTPPTPGHTYQLMETPHFCLPYCTWPVPVIHMAQLICGHIQKAGLPQELFTVFNNWLEVRSQRGT